MPRSHLTPHSERMLGLVMVQAQSLHRDPVLFVLHESLMQPAKASQKLSTVILHAGAQTLMQPAAYMPPPQYLGGPQGSQPMPTPPVAPQYLRDQAHHALFPPDLAQQVAAMLEKGDNGRPSPDDVAPAVVAPQPQDIHDSGGR